jgi:hypothetical protein
MGKEVRWEGLVKSIDLSKEPPSVVMDMPGSLPADANGVTVNKATDLIVFVLNPEASEIASWKDVTKGQTVRFRARTAGGITNSVVSFSAIPGHKMLMINTAGGQLLNASANDAAAQTGGNTATPEPPVVGKPRDSVVVAPTAPAQPSDGGVKSWRESWPAFLAELNGAPGVAPVPAAAFTERYGGQPVKWDVPVGLVLAGRGDSIHTVFMQPDGRVRAQVTLAGEGAKAYVSVAATVPAGTRDRWTQLRPGSTVRLRATLDPLVYVMTRAGFQLNLRNIEMVEVLAEPTYPAPRAVAPVAPAPVAAAIDTSLRGPPLIARQMVQAFNATHVLSPIAALSFSVGSAEGAAINDGGTRLWNAGLAITGDRISNQSGAQVLLAYGAWLRSRRPMTAQKVAMYESRFHKIDKATIDAWQVAEAKSGTPGNSRMLTLAAIAFQDFLFQGEEWKEGNPARALHRLGSLSRDAVERWKALAKGDSNEEAPFAAWSLIAVDTLFSADEFQTDVFNTTLPFLRPLNASGRLTFSRTPPVPDRPIEELIIAADSSDRAIKGRAISALARSKDPRALNALVQLMQNADQDTRNVLIPLVCRGEATDPRAIGPMIEVLKSRSMLGYARSCLLTTNDRRAVGPMLDDIGPPDAEVFQAAAEWLKKMTGKEFATVKEWHDWWRVNEAQFNKR